MTLIDSDNLRFIWGLVEDYSHLLKDMNDDAMCFWLLKRIKASIQLNPAETNEIKRYLGTRIHLIRHITNPNPEIQGYATSA